jgi:hypothetical protein
MHNSERIFAAGQPACPLTCPLGGPLRAAAVLSSPVPQPGQAGGGWSLPASAAASWPHTSGASRPQSPAPEAAAGGEPEAGTPLSRPRSGIPSGRRAKWGSCDAPDGVLVLMSPTGPASKAKGLAGAEAPPGGEQQGAEDGLIRAWREPAKEDTAAAGADGQPVVMVALDAAAAAAALEPGKQQLKAAASEEPAPGSGQPVVDRPAPSQKAAGGGASVAPAGGGQRQPQAQQRRRSSGAGARPGTAGRDRSHPGTGPSAQASTPRAASAARPRSSSNAGGLSSGGGSAAVVAGASSPLHLGAPTPALLRGGILGVAGKDAGGPAPPCCGFSAAQWSALQQEVGQLRQQQLSMAAVLQQLTQSSTAAVASLQARIATLEAAAQAQALAALASPGRASVACGSPVGAAAAALGVGVPPLLELHQLQAVAAAALPDGWAAPGAAAAHAAPGLSRSLDDWQWRGAAGSGMTGPAWGSPARQFPVGREAERGAGDAEGALTRPAAGDAPGGALTL